MANQGARVALGFMGVGAFAVGTEKGYLPVLPLKNFLGYVENKCWGVAPAKEPELRNHAFVFIKPHANTPAMRELVRRKLARSGINVTTDGEITGEQINDNLYIDQHYYAIASKATILKPKELNVPEGKFKDKFGLGWADALKEGIVFNAMDACKELDVDSEGLNKLWAQAKNDGELVKFGGGFYCGKIPREGKDPIYVFNGFFMSMRSKFTTPGTSIHYYTVDFSPKVLSWEQFRGGVLGPTDPATAPEGSLRRDAYDNWQALGLDDKPNVGDNAVHASASPFEGLAERNNWLKTPIKADPFGAALVDAGVGASTIAAWSVDPQVPIGDGKKGSLFDQLEDLDVQPCLKKCVQLSQL